MRPLEGVVVIELSMSVSGSACGKVLAEYGAEVIKVETGKGDNYRRFGEVFGVPAEADENIVFETVNSGKKFVQLNLRDEADQLRMRKLLSKADVFVTNYRPAALKMMSLDYATLKEEFPRLIYASITGYGERGSRVNRPGFDTVSFWAESGFLQDMMVDAPGSYPVYVPVGAGDSIVGTELAGGVGMALYQREKTGRGTSVGISLYGTAIWTFSPLSSATQYGYRWPRGRYEGSPGGTPYRTKDNLWVLTTLEKYSKYWPGLCRAFRAYELIDDPRYNSRAATVVPENRKNAILALEKHAAELTADEICRALDDEDIVYTVLGHMRDNHNCVPAIINDHVVAHVYDSGKEVTVAKPPMRFEGCGPMQHTPTGDVGADTEAVFAEFGID